MHGVIGKRRGVGDGLRKWEDEWRSWEEVRVVRCSSAVWEDRKYDTCRRGEDWRNNGFRVQAERREKDRKAEGREGDRRKRRKGKDGMGNERVEQRQKRIGNERVRERQKMMGNERVREG